VASPTATAPLSVKIYVFDIANVTTPMAPNCKSATASPTLLARRHHSPLPRRGLMARPPVRLVI
jgi:hypothetical protein